MAWQDVDELRRLHADSKFKQQLVDIFSLRELFLYGMRSPNFVVPEALE